MSFPIRFPATLLREADIPIELAVRNLSHSLTAGDAEQWFHHHKPALGLGIGKIVDHRLPEAAGSCRWLLTDSLWDIHSSSRKPLFVLRPEVGAVCSDPVSRGPVLEFVAGYFACLYAGLWSLRNEQIPVPTKMMF